MQCTELQKYLHDAVSMTEFCVIWLQLGLEGMERMQMQRTQYRHDDSAWEHALRRQETRNKIDYVGRTGGRIDANAEFGCTTNYADASVCEDERDRNKSRSWSAESQM